MSAKCDPSTKFEQVVGSKMADSLAWTLLSNLFTGKEPVKGFLKEDQSNLMKVNPLHLAEYQICTQILIH